MTDIAEIIARALGERRRLDWDANSVQLLDWSNAALTALQEHGFVVVPVVPTEEMVAAYADPNVGRAHWELMLAASPGAGKEMT